MISTTHDSMNSHLGMRRAFTLMEMLVVLAIIAIIAVLVVPAVRGFGQSAALTSGGNLIANAANVARQNAVSKNTMTALLLLGNQGTDQDYRAVAVLEYDPVAGWSQTNNWEFLPNGVVVDANDTANCSFLVNSPQPFPFLSRAGGQKNPPAVFEGKQVADGGGYAARIFLPNGTLENAEKAAQIRLVEGYVQNGHVVYTRPGPKGGPSNYYDIAILGLSGTTKITRP